MCNKQNIIKNVCNNDILKILIVIMIIFLKSLEQNRTWYYKIIIIKHSVNYCPLIILVTSTTQVQIFFDPYHNIDPCQKPCLTISVGDNMYFNLIPSVSSVGNADDVFICVHWILVFYPLIIYVFYICKKEKRHLISSSWQIIEIFTVNKLNEWIYIIKSYSC